MELGTLFSQVFFRAGMLAKFEELRDEAISKFIVTFQRWLRWYISQVKYI